MKNKAAVLVFGWFVLGALPALAAAVPQLPEGTVPYFVEDPVLPSSPDQPAGFACYGGCGASCACEGRADSQATTCAEGQRCTWKTTSCLTHSFCRWHDACYLRCDDQFPGKVNDFSIERPLCYRDCDLSCVTGKDPNPIGGWDPADLDPGPPPEHLGAVMCARRLAHDPSVPFDGVMVFAALSSCEPDPACDLSAH